MPAADCVWQNTEIICFRTVVLEWWNARLKEAGFDVIETGTPPATLYLLARRL